MSTPPPPVRGTALVTGASSGIGAATALRLAQDGWQVVAAARRVDRLSALAAQHPAIRPQPLDVTDPRSVEQLVDAVPECALVVANAGGALDLAPLADADVDDWARMYDLNVLGVVRTVQALLPAAARVPRAGGHDRVDRRPVGVRERRRLRRGQVRAQGAARGAPAGGRRRPGSGSARSRPGWCRPRSSRWCASTATRPRPTPCTPGVDPLTAEDVADAIAWVASRPAHVNIDLVQLTPQQQAASYKVDRR